MPTVYRARPYRFGAMGSLGDAAYMIIRQYQFPHTYSERDKHISADSDRCFQRDHEHVCRCFKEHLGTGEMGFESWVRGATDEQIIKFLKDLLKADLTVNWTGYRILGSVHRGNGYPVWTLELFYNLSGTKVYTGPNAPNVEKSQRYSNYSS